MRIKYIRDTQICIIDILIKDRISHTRLHSVFFSEILDGLWL